MRDGSRRLAFAVVTLALALVLSASLGAAQIGAEQSRKNVLDRTVSCAIAGVGSPDPARYLSVFAFPKRPQPSGAPLVSASHGEGEGGVSIGLTAGNPALAWINVSQCKPVRKRVPLAAGSLAGGRTAFGEQQRCEVPARILVRIQAVFARPFALRTDPDRRYQRVARGRIESGSLAVATLEGKPIAFARTDAATGRASMFAARALCFPS